MEQPTAQPHPLDIVDPKYLDTQIYCIICMITGEMYVGSTFQTLKERMWYHVSLSSNCTSRQIIDRGNYKSYTIQKWSCNTKREVLTLEGQWQRAYKTCFPEHLVNKQIEGQFVYESTESKKAYDSQWYQDNKAEHNVRGKKWREANQERYRFSNKEWKERNKERNKKNNKEYNSRPWTCEWCKKTMNTSSKARHKRRCKSKPTQ
jgi:hypothetical protein